MEERDDESLILILIMPVYHLYSWPMQYLLCNKASHYLNAMQLFIYEFIINSAKETMGCDKPNDELCDDENPIAVDGCYICVITIAHHSVHPWIIKY